MFIIAYAFKGQVYVFAGRVIIVSYLSCRESAILKYLCPLMRQVTQAEIFLSSVGAQCFTCMVSSFILCLFQ